MEERNNIFGQLKRLFARDTIIRNVGGKQLKVMDFDKIQAFGNIQTNALYSKFSKLNLISGAYSNTPLLNYQTLRAALYTDYEAMDTDAIISSALDVIADECTLRNENGEVLQIKSSDEKIQQVLYNLHYDILNCEFNLPIIFRSLAKYGDFYWWFHMAEKFGIVNAIALSVYSVEREEGFDHSNPSAVRFKYEPNGSFGIMGPQTDRKYLEKFEVSHFRNQIDPMYAPYGRSYIEPARKIYKQLSLTEDAMLIHRIMRAPEKRIFYLNTSMIPPDKVAAYMEQVKQNTKKVPYQDPMTGDYNLKYNMQNITEDYYIPVPGNDTTTRIDTAKGLEYMAMDDVIYLRDKLLGSLKIPKSYLGYEADVSGKCISPYTKIPLLDGRVLTVQEIIEEYNNGIKNYVYSLDEETHNIVPGEIEWAGFTRKNAQVVRVWLDNNEYIDCTPDHKFMTRDGKYKEAQYLCENEALMPLYLQKSTTKNIQGYFEVYNPKTGLYEFVHRLVANYYNIKEEGKVIHHIDCNKLNNNPENLDGSMDFWEHRKWHIEHNMLCHSEEASKKRKNTWKKLGQNLEYRDKNKEIWKKNSDALVKWIRKNGASRKGFIKNTHVKCKGCDNIIDKTKVDPNKRYLIYCSEDCRKQNSHSKYKNITLEVLKDKAKECKNFKELKSLLGIKDHGTLRKVFEYLNIDKEQFIINNMPLAHNNPAFMNQFSKTNEYFNYKNHKVVKVEWLDNNIDTCDLTISKYHNFGTEAGVIIHNSTLSAQDIRFARTIERFQRIVLSELTRISLIHLYMQGFEESELTNFELSLTTPSIIYEQERIALAKEKMEVASQMMETGLFPSDYIYETIFDKSEDEYSEYRRLIIEDKKRQFRLTQIQEEGNDPVVTGVSVGTPHDLAVLYGKGRYGNGDTPTPIEDKNKVGRPETQVSNYGTQNSPFGRDPLGREGSKPNYSSASPAGSSVVWALENKLYPNQLTELKQIKNLYETKEVISMLDEKNIKDI